MCGTLWHASTTVVALNFFANSIILSFVYFFCLSETEFFGFKEYFDTADLIVIEWPNRISGLDFSIDIEITITIKNNSRDLIFKSRSDRGSLVLKKLKSKILR